MNLPESSDGLAYYNWTADPSALLDIITWADEVVTIIIRPETPEPVTCG